MDNSIFGVSEKALGLCEDRAKLLTDNIVNASTPHYKAKDIDFHKTLQDAHNYILKTDQPGQIGADNQVDASQVLYRIPQQMSIDGNTVDDDIERKNFVENAMRYQVNLTFIKNKTDELLTAMKGD